MAAARQTSADPDPQDGLFDEVLENEILAAALERRQAAKEKRADAAKRYTDADQAAKGIIAGLELEPDVTARCGRFRIRSRTIPARHVEFDTDPSVRLRIDLLE